ncbi:MAG: type III restriction-modification system endonuclease [Hydrogenovibrio sp.]
MKLHFEPNLDYQHEAIEAICGLFKGQEICRTEFTVTKDALGGAYLQGMESYLGIGNRLKLLDDEILKNLNDIQLHHGLRPSESLASGDFTIEMETGTGKTYVYLRTIFELYKRYGFTKYVIVVPSIAIKEGTIKTLKITRDHFESLYPGSKGYEFFQYDSSKLGQVRNFATSPHIQIMVVTVGAINKKDVNNLYKESEKTGGEKPIDLVRATRPVIIVDEPQSVDGGLEGRGKEALGAMNPLCTLRYSATHVDKHQMVYRLDAVDAYDRKLVKQIEVASADIQGAFNRPYVRLVSTKSQSGTVTARVELDVQGRHGVKRKEVTVQDGDDLEQTTGRGIYEGFRIGEIRTGRNNQLMEVRHPGGEDFLEPGQAIGMVNQDDLKRQMIRRTIKEHLDKELRLAPQGIKVLSLFFIDHVANYRSYDQDGNSVKGKYALIFEEEYRRLAKHPDYATLFKGIDLETDAVDVHNGYFSIDKKGTWQDTAENNQTNRDSAERAYNLIMRDKEALLSFDSKLKFIFSHSALREGWDNPNIFQICTLRDIGTERQRRQTIGRGLRLCVDQSGNRVRGFETNILTVVATESYRDFADNLQREIEEDTGIRFGIVESHQFAGIGVIGDDGQIQPLGVDNSETIWKHIKEKGYIDNRGKVQDTLRTALKEGKVDLPEAFECQRQHIESVLKKSAGKLDVKDADKGVVVKTRQAILQSEEFKALWDRIKHKTTYRVHFDNDALIKASARAIENGPPVSRTRLTWRKADLEIGKAGIQAETTSISAPVAIDESDIELPDILTDLQDKTKLTRQSIVSILVASNRLDDFKKNPQEFTDICAEAINRAKRLALVDGIKYQRLGDEHYYAQELFETEELHGYLTNMLESSKSVYEHVVYDSEGVEKGFAEQLEKNEAVKVYAKLPGWFKVPTPLGTYNPDWAVLIEKKGVERLYFVVETKGTLFGDAIRATELAKIDCGREHFKALGSAAQFTVANSYESFSKSIMQ